jgi:dTDP-4-amino-4,6-dideoxygalactose transaminase
MSNDQLAINGGTKSVTQPFALYKSIGKEEADAVAKVMESGNLSQFVGAWGPDFLGGPNVKEFEKQCEQYFGVKHAITVNSWTSGLIAAVGAIGIEPGDEVIVTPWTMCASATAILFWNAIPVFVDIDKETFNLDPEQVRKNISPKTKAILSVDIFGHPGNTDELMKIAEEHNLKVISDTAQAPGATYNGKMAGTMTHVGGYSLNYHKHIHTGEGGVLVTEDDNIADRLRLIRNHAEAVVDGMGVQEIDNMLGYNFRLGELEAAIGREQLKKLETFVDRKRTAAHRLTAGLSKLDGLITPVEKEGYTHAYYCYALVLDKNIVKAKRSSIVAALAAEGVTGLVEGYANIHRLPMYQKKIAYGKKGFPWTSEICEREVDYSKGICPVAEELHDETLINFLICHYDLNNDDVDAIIRAFEKVWSKIDEL